MKGFLKSEAGTVILWILGTLILAATLLPWIHASGKNLAARAATEDLSPFLEWLGAAADRGKYSRYFSRTLTLSALLLTPLMVWRLKSISRPTTLPSTTQKSSTHPVLQITLGILIAGGFLWALGGILIAAGAFTADPTPPPIGKILTKALIPAIGASFLEEWLFRGLLLGAFLRIAKPATACIANSLVFAFVHFLTPPEGTVIANPNAPLAGFELLAAILKNFLNPQFFAAEFATLFTVGMILGWARLSTGKLWFSIGLHAGWIAAFKAFNLLNDLNHASPLHPWGIGLSLRSGLLPLATLALTAAVCLPILKRLKPKPATSPDSAFPPPN